MQGIPLREVSPMATVQDILRRKGSEVVSMVADESVVNAARLMNERGIGGVVVMDGGSMVGIFTERDILRRVVAEHRDPAETKIREVMTSPVTCCPVETSQSECMKVMTENRIRHLPVVRGEDVVGIVTSGDLLAYRVKDQESTIELMKSYVYDNR
jgi:CBS domain-containing protein